MTAQQIFNEYVHSWEERELYPVTREEFEILLSGGGLPVERDRPNEDGTFFNSLLFQGKVFCTSISKDGGL